MVRNWYYSRALHRIKYNFIKKIDRLFETRLEGFLHSAGIRSWLSNILIKMFMNAKNIVCLAMESESCNRSYDLIHTRGCAIVTSENEWIMLMNENERWSTTNDLRSWILMIWSCIATGYVSYLACLTGMSFDWWSKSKVFFCLVG